MAYWKLFVRSHESSDDLKLKGLVMKIFTRCVPIVALMTALSIAHPASAQELTKVKVGRLTFASMMTIFTDIIKDQKLDQKNGIDMELVNHGTVVGHYAAYASGEADLGSGGPLAIQKLRNEGVPLAAVFTLVRLNSMVVITSDPTVRSIQDLKGKTMAADMGASEFYILSTFGKSVGLDIGKDISVVQANPAAARAQLQAKRVDAVMTWEPSATMTLGDSKDYRVILNGDTAWNQLSKNRGWELVVIMRDGYLKQNPLAVPKLLKVFQSGVDFLKANPDAADAIAVKTVKLPPGVFKDAITSGRLDYSVMPAWQERNALLEMFQLAVKTGYLPKLPDEGAIYRPVR
jgi:ABC-type nitrate/sulfonate/bicarbonate transport system substrate-binding protein